ncbi:MAG: class I SAM-dependent methyltransferase [Myxococcales bacterium]|nr:class I SAM-dependent methyltransferase [Myxococcales bacterium]
MSAACETSTPAAVWNQVLAPKFIRFRHVLIAGAQPHGARAIARWGPARGDTVFDVGCGFGDATLELSEAVGPGGLAVGLDVVPDFLAFGREAARDAGVGHARFEAMDVEQEAPGERADMVFSRFGTMFFERPVAAFRNLRRMLRPGGRLAMTTWRSLDDNPWLKVAKEVALVHLPPPGDGAVTCGPGPFSLNDSEVVTAILSRAGFSDVRLAESHALTPVGRTVEEAVAFQLAIGPAGEIIREAGALGAARTPAVTAAMARALEPYMCEDGVLMPSSAWIVTASAC